MRMRLMPARVAAPWRGRRQLPDLQGRQYHIGPEAARLMDEAAARADAELRAEIPAGRPGPGLAAEIKTGQQPYPEIAASRAAAYRLAAVERRPEFHPAPSVAPVTAPMAALPANAKVPPPPPAPEAGQDEALLRRVHEAMQRKWRAESFLADKRALPLFDAVTKELGWQGLHVPAKAAGWQRWSTVIWAARERALADAACMQARAELDAVRARYAAAAASASGGVA